EELMFDVEFTPPQHGASPVANLNASPVANFCDTTWSVSQILFHLWLAGLFAYFGSVAYCYLWALRVLAQGKALESGPIFDLLRQLGKRLKLRRLPQVVLSDSVHSPFLWGLFRGRIALPAGLPGEVSPQELECVLLHELTHWRRGDMLIARLELFVCGLFWFHPLVWLSLWNLRKERESACDEAVLEFGGVNTKEYGDSLLSVLKITRERPMVPVALPGFLGFFGISEHNSQTHKRLEEIMSQSTQIKRMGFPGWGMILLLALCVLPMAAAQKEEATDGVKQETKEAAPVAAEVPKEPNEPPRLHIIERDGEIYLKEGELEILAKPLAVAPVPEKDPATFNTVGAVSLKRMRLGAAMKSLSHEECQSDFPEFAKVYPAGGYLVNMVWNGSQFDIKNVRPGDIIVGIDRWKMDSETSIPWFSDYYYEKGTLVKVFLFRRSDCYYIEIPINFNRKPADGGYVSPSGFTHVVAIGGKGDFVPKTKTQFSRAISELFQNSTIGFGVVRSRVEDGKLILLELTGDPEGMQEVLDASDTMQYLRSERLTKEFYDTYFRDYDNSHFLPPEDGGFVWSGHQYIVTLKPKGNFHPKTTKELTSEMNRLFPWAFAGRYQFNFEAGEMIGSVFTDDAEILKETLNNSSTLEFVQAQRLTLELYEQYEKRPNTAADGGFATPGPQGIGGFTHLVYFMPTGDFAPRTPSDLLPKVSFQKMNEFSVTLGYFRTKPEDGKLIGSFATGDPENFEKMIQSIPDLEFIKSERLTKESFEAYEKTPQLSLVSSETQKRMEGIQQSEWYKKLTPHQQKYVQWDENTFAHAYDPKNYEVGDKRAEFEAKWVKLLEGPEPGYPGMELTPYVEAIFGLATIKSDKATPLLVKIAAERVVKDNAHRHYATKALGELGDKAAIPELIPLVYHFNMNTRWDAQVSLVRLTGENFGVDAKAWGEWYNANRAKLGKNLPPFDSTPVDWTCGSDDGELKKWADPKFQKEMDEKF
ncbi:MAG: M48 family metalloprotease, partial [Planctomycetaceae bacterium]|nr:M48 family metalloprotease [Planctomycetaceae bacterium]